MILQIMMRISQTKNNSATFYGFTLIELIVVLVIISVMVAVVVPYATRSNKSRELKEECLNIVALIKYAINLAIDTNKPTRIGINIKDNNYLVEMATDMSGQSFKPADGFFGILRYFNKTTRVSNLAGFDMEGNSGHLIFDPRKPWRDAMISLSTDTLVETIHIGGQQVELEGSAI